MAPRDAATDAQRMLLAYDEGAMDVVARAIYCAARPDLASVWCVECAETRRHYYDLASAAFLASLQVLRDSAVPVLAEVKAIAAAD